MNLNRSHIKIIFYAFIICSLVACGVPLIEGQNWLDSQSSKPETDISGKWYSPEWGQGDFQQKDGAITGILGDYQVKGKVSGYYIYLLMYTGNRVDYSAELKLDDAKTIKGNYSKYAILDEKAKRNSDVFIRSMSLFKSSN